MDEAINAEVTTRGNVDKLLDALPSSRSKLKRLLLKANNKPDYLTTIRLAPERKYTYQTFSAIFTIHLQLL